MREKRDCPSVRRPATCTAPHSEGVPSAFGADGSQRDEEEDVLSRRRSEAVFGTLAWRWPAASSRAHAGMAFHPPRRSAFDLKELTESVACRVRPLHHITSTRPAPRRGTRPESDERSGEGHWRACSHGLAASQAPARPRGGSSRPASHDHTATAAPMHDIASDGRRTERARPRRPARVRVPPRRPRAERTRRADHQPAWPLSAHSDMLLAQS